jgi:hypothetical protein
MPLDLSASAPTLLIRRAAFERAGLVRADIDARYNLTPDEFRVEGALITIGPLVEEDAVGDLIEQLEGAGLVYFDDFFELSGNWPAWCQLYVRGAE